MKKKIAFAVVAVALVVIVAIIWRQFDDPNGSAPENVAYGNVDIRDANLAFRVGGRVTEILVEEGDAVEPGQTVARLDAEPYKIALQSARAQLDQANAKLEQLKSGFRKEEIDQAKATVTEREAALAQARRTRDRQRQLHQAKVGTDEALDTAESAYDTAAARLEVAQANLALMQAGYRKEEIAQAEAAAAQAQSAVEQAQLQIADSELDAPSRGTILTRAIETGAMVGAGQTVLTVSLQDRVWARAYVSETQLARIRPGMPVQVSIDGRAEPYSGHIGFISPKAEFTPKNVETTELRASLVYRFRVVIDQPDAALRQGMPVTVNWAAEDANQP